MTSNHISIDLGASSGRVILGALTDGVLTVSEAHRFQHHMIECRGVKRWDWAWILREVRRGLSRACAQAGDRHIAGVSCSAWAQDFGLLNAQGELFYPPVSYRDDRTKGLPERFNAVIAPCDLHRRDGSLVHPMTTLCQLRAMAEHEPEALCRARDLLWIADLVHWDLCGAAATDWSLATASQVRHVASGTWDTDLLARLDIPASILPPILPQPQVIGTIPAGSAPDSHLVGVPVISSAGHDTAAASAVLAPLEPGTLMLSLGTWAMLGACTGKFQVPDKDQVAVLGLPFGQWGCFHGGMGLWLLQECRRAWRESGANQDISELVVSAARSSVESVIPVNDPRFFAPDNMPAEIAGFCAATRQAVPEHPGDFARVIFDSLAAAFADSIDQLRELTGLSFERLRIVGGGCRNEYLCRRTAQGACLPVVCGPVEATAAGNLLLQAVALGLLEPVVIPEVMAVSFPLVEYAPPARSPR
ncbi:MAG: hypothetical protein HN742_11500 [Lentisphaerae bacterium]|jgi:rhamnulokinase|nr:hypothetical protein [Lentisphaerota bacterium]MBT4821305.1 hypothetical protein [Lentisphaerota bacterium]MBT5609868.1 hypothetical protein [Lentisphaerota bacterium]MBT7060011.1 hypothetical protein [Lentisphaerota bacterium]MBT7842492.1 hypothetical protein [Lentisphaerota bacterium]